MDIGYGPFPLCEPQCQSPTASAGVIPGILMRRTFRCRAGMLYFLPPRSMRPCHLTVRRFRQSSAFCAVWSNGMSTTTHGCAAIIPTVKAARASMALCGASFVRANPASTTPTAISAAPSYSTTAAGASTISTTAFAAASRSCARRCSLPMRLPAPSRRTGCRSRRPRGCRGGQEGCRTPAVSVLLCREQARANSRCRFERRAKGATIAALAEATCHKRRPEGRSQRGSSRSNRGTYQIPRRGIARQLPAIISLSESLACITLSYVYQSLIRFAMVWQMTAKLGQGCGVQ